MLIFERLEAALKRYRSKVVMISDIIGLFLDQDVPKKESRQGFMKITRYLVELASRRRVVIIATCFPRHYSSRSMFLEAILFGRANTVVWLKKSRGAVKFALELHRSIKPFIVNFASDVVTMDMFYGGLADGKNCSLISSSVGS